MDRDLLDDDRLQHWREFVETGLPEVVAAWACSDISEETFFASWGEGCSDQILDAARGGRQYAWDIHPDDKVLLLRLWERLGKRWPQYIGPNDAPFVYPLRRWLIEATGEPMTRLSECWEHGIVARAPPIDLSPGVSLVPPGLHRLSDGLGPTDTTYTVCRHRAVVVTRTALGPGRIPLYVPPEGCDRVFFASPHPPETQLLHAEVERLMSELPPTSPKFRRLESR